MKLEVSRAISDYIFETMQKEADRLRDDALGLSWRAENVPAALVRELILAQDACVELAPQQANDAPDARSGSKSPAGQNG